MGTQLRPPKKGHSPRIFGPCLLWRNSCPSQLLLSTCFVSFKEIYRLLLCFQNCCTFGTFFKLQSRKWSCFSGKSYQNYVWSLPCYIHCVSYVVYLRLCCMIFTCEVKQPSLLCHNDAWICSRCTFVVKFDCDFQTHFGYEYYLVLLLLWPPCVARKRKEEETTAARYNVCRTLYFADLAAVVSSYFFFSSLILSGRRLVIYHTSTHDVALLWI